MDDLYAVIGRKQVELDSLNAEYTKLLSVLGEVVAGRIPVERVEIDHAQRSWKVLPAA